MGFPGREQNTSHGRAPRSGVALLPGLGLDRRRLRARWLGSRVIQPLFILLGILVAAQGSLAQTVAVRGRVRHSSGSVIADAAGRIYQGGQVVAETDTDAPGEVSLAGAPGGDRPRGTPAR